MRVRDLGQTHSAALCETCPSVERCLTPSLLQHLQDGRAADLRISTYPTAAWIIRQHQPQVGIHIVCTGSVAISAERADRRETVLYIGGRDCIMNLEDWALARPIYSLSARALTESTVIFIGKDDLRRLYESDPAIAQLMTHYLARRMESAQQRHIRSMTTDVKSRLMTAFSELLEATGQQTDQTARFQFPITRQLLADIVGAAPESISRVLTDLEAETLIMREPAHIAIPDVPRFLARAGSTTEEPPAGRPSKAPAHAAMRVHPIQPRRHR